MFFKLVVCMSGSLSLCIPSGRPGYLSHILVACILALIILLRFIASSLYERECNRCNWRRCLNVACWRPEVQHVFRLAAPRMRMRSTRTASQFFFIPSTCSTVHPFPAAPAAVYVSLGATRPYNSLRDRPSEAIPLPFPARFLLAAAHRTLWPSPFLPSTPLRRLARTILTTLDDALRPRRCGPYVLPHCTICGRHS